MKKLLPLLLTISLLSVNASAYGPRGHQLVGSIADKRLARNRAVARKVRRLLDELTLERVATLPDEIKSWNDCGSRPPSPNPVVDRVRINNELRAFLQANLCSAKPAHDEFHYTDVPVTGGEEYADGEVGRGKFDIVQMIPYCLRVLRGEEPETNERAITKTVAVILLAHYLGDIHQPLHVGAEFFDADGNPFHPSASNHGFGDQGGNKLTLFTFVDGQLTAVGKLHSYWDSQTVNNAFGDATNASIAARLARRAPGRWRLTGAVDTWAEQMANDALPLAREARSRLEYKNVEIVADEHEIKSGEAREKRRRGNQLYDRWSAGVVRSEIHKGGWRLAALLEQALR
ncbi:MAG TPA: S1/P1 nuclease [Pyrinomonadaceae bacterium]|nr:S1/P1 nuclease [Pyrinomonadaceae bacterium]